MARPVFILMIAIGFATSPGLAPSQTVQRDWPQLGGSPTRNNIALGKNIPTEWDVGEFDDDSWDWIPGSGKNIKWVARIESGSWPPGMASGPAVSGGKIFVGSSNYFVSYVPRFPKESDLACLLCLREGDGKFLWQYTSEKLTVGRSQDYPLNCLASTPYVEGDRLWTVTNRNEVICLDTEGFLDGENDGPLRDEPNEHRDEADVIWKLDLLERFGATPYLLARSAITAAGDTIFVGTSNGIDGWLGKTPSPQAPSFLAINKTTGQVLWSDNSPGENVLHAQWSGPAYAVLGGVPQVIFAGGDGWLYAFDPAGDGQGKSKLLWKFDCNSKANQFALGAKGNRNSVVLAPVISDGRVYAAVGDDPNHGDGKGHLYCIDPTRRGDVSAELVIDPAKPTQPVPQRRFDPVRPGELVTANPNSAQVWRFDNFDLNNDGQTAYEETIHRTCGTPTIKDGLLYVADLSGLFLCLDARTGQLHWTYDLLATCFASPLVVDDKVYLIDEDGDVTIVEHSAKFRLIAENNLGGIGQATLVVVNDVLYANTRRQLLAIESPKK